MATSTTPPPFSPMAQAMAAGKTFHEALAIEALVLDKQFDKVIQDLNSTDDTGLEQEVREIRQRTFDMMMVQSQMLYRQVKLTRNWIVNLIGLFLFIELIQHLF